MSVDGGQAELVNLEQLNQYRHRPDQLRILIEGFLTTAWEQLQQIETSVQNQQVEPAKALLHALKGSALSTSATEFAQGCQELLDRTWEAGAALDSTSIQGIMRQFDQTREVLQQYLDDLPREDQETLPASHRFTVLIVEDNTSTRTQMRLEMEHRYHLLEASNGCEALALIEKEPIDLAIIDLNLGPSHADHPSGFQLLARLKNRLPTIVLTVDQRPQSIQKAIAAGASYYIVKSADLTNLQVAIEVLLARSSDRTSHSNTPTVDLATGWLMATYKLSQDSAHEVLLKLAMEKRCQANDIAQELLDSHQLYTDLGRFVMESFNTPAVKED